MTAKPGMTFGKTARICGIFGLAAIFLGAANQARTADTAPARGMRITSPAQVRVRGEMAERMKLAVRYLDQTSRNEWWSGFRPKLSPTHSEGMWGADFPGRTLETYSRISMSLGELASARYNELAYGMIAHQTPDGAFHNGEPIGDATGGAYGSASNLSAKGTGFWFGNARGLTGLVWARRYRPSTALFDESARALGNFSAAHYFDADQPGLPSGSFWWVMNDALMELYRDTSDAKYLDAATSIGLSIPPVNKGSQHTHSYLMSLRGIVQTCELTGQHPELMAKVLEQYAYFRDHVMWPGGGIVEHLGDRKTFNPCYWYDEGCSVCDWLSLNLALWRVTREPHYMDMAERVALNHLLYDQDESGGFCGERGVDFIREGSPWPFCCAMYGGTMLSEVTQYVATTDGKDVWLNLYYPASAELALDGGVVKLNEETNYPADGKLQISIDPAQPMPFTLRARVPAWSRVLALSVNGTAIAEPQVTDGYVAIERTWQPGDKVALELAMTLRSEPRNEFIGNDAATDMSRVSVWKGPRQLVFNEALNIDLWKAAAARPALRHAYQAYETLQLNQSIKGTPLTMGGKVYQKGLGTHAMSEIVFALGGGFKEFISDIGIDEAAKGGGAVRFKVCVDGLMRAGDVVKAGTAEGGAGMVAALYGFQTSAMTGKDAPKTIRVGVENAQVLRLVVDDAVNGLDNDYGNWGDARLVKADGTVVYLSDLPDDRALGLPWDWGTLQLREVAAAGSADLKTVALAYKSDKGEAPARFNYLADLGYTLIKARPVLNQYMKVE